MELVLNGFNTIFTNGSLMITFQVLSNKIITYFSWNKQKCCEKNFPPRIVDNIWILSKNQEARQFSKQIIYKIKQLFAI